MKYIIFDVTVSKGVKKKVPVIFDEFLVHADVARKLQDVSKPLKLRPATAGFIDFDVKQTYGKSTSLGIGIGIDDCEIIERMYLTKGYQSPEMDDLISSLVSKAEAVASKMVGKVANDNGPLICPVCTRPDNRPHEGWHTIYNCHFDCIEGYEALAEGQTLAPPASVPNLMAAARQALDQSRAAKQEPTLAHAFTHTCQLPSVVPNVQMDTRTAKPLLFTCQRAVQALIAARPASPLFKRAHWHSRQALMASQRFTQAYLFHAYQLAAMSAWEDNAEKIECMTLINLVQTMDPHNELRDKVFTVNTQHGTVTTHSLSQAKSFASRQV
ncbi:hypothetical protein Voja6_00017 [Pseudomonas phage vB_PpuM-Voja-6]